MAVGGERRAVGRSVIVAEGPSRRVVAARDKVELRAQMQETVHRYTTMLRERLLPVLRRENPGKSEQEIAELLDARQPLYEEFDPVLLLGAMAVDHSYSPELRRQAAAEAASYVRPKLKSIELVADPTGADAEQRRALAGRLVGLLDAASEAKREAGSTIDAEARDVTGDTTARRTE